MGSISGTTRIIGLIGTPIVQVKMPPVFNDYTAPHGMDVIMIPMDVAPDGVADLIRAARHWNNLYGIVVTLPFKQVTAALCDTLTDRARRLTTANVISRDANGTLTGEILNGVGFVEAARASGFDPAGNRGDMIGAGGVASAIANSLCESGIARLSIEIEAVRGELTTSQLATKHGVHQTMINDWKRMAIAVLASIFDGKRVERDFLAKASGRGASTGGGRWSTMPIPCSRSSASVSWCRSTDRGFTMSLPAKSR